MNMYFAAIVAPEEINQKALAWKQWINEKYGSHAALRSPAHITLIPPFWMDEELEKDLADSMEVFAAGRQNFLVRLENFSVFEPRVVFIEVLPSAGLQLLQKELLSFLLEINRYPIKEDNRPFHPHVTLATRDLYKKDFYELWEYFKGEKYQAEWPVESISLLRHNQKKWDVINTSHFKEV